jgi:hypothetical protein
VLRARTPSALQDGRALRSAHCEDSTWAAYFEGKIEGKCTVAVAESSADMLKQLQTQVCRDLSYIIANDGQEQLSANWLTQCRVRAERVGLVLHGHSWERYNHHRQYHRNHHHRHRHHHTQLLQQVSDNELSLECVAWGEGAWFLFFLEHPSHEQGDTNWVVNGVYVTPTRPHLSSLPTHRPTTASLMITSLSLASPRP